MKEAEMAFLSGYMAHVVGDAVFHPLVLYTVGKGEGRPQYEHHVFESVLDLYILDRWGKEEGALPTLPTTLKELTHRMTSSGELTRKGFLRMLGAVSFLGASYSAESLQTCLKRYERIQGWFWTSLGCVGARLLKALNRKYAFFEASFYQKRFYRYREAFRGMLEYRHPVTGASRTVAIEDLVMEMVEEGLSHAVRLEPLFNQILGAGKTESWFETPTEMFRFNGPSGELAPASGGEAQSAVADVPGFPHSGGSGGPGEIPPGIEILPAVLEGLRALQGPNLETGLFADRADRILYTRAEGLAGLFGPYGYRRG